MAIGEKVETRGHVVGFKEEIQKAQMKSSDAFFTWFDHAQDAQSAFIKGNWDFSAHIAQPLSTVIEKPEQKTVLEIGHGGGRVIAAASHYFKSAIGVDIHAQNDVVKQEFNSRGISNVELFESNGKTIPVPDQSVDVVYSFIVLQHVEKKEVFESYVNEAYRVLRSGGVALLYFGRYHHVSVNTSSRLLYAVDRVLEALYLRGGYKEIAAPVNCVNLFVSLHYAKKIARAAGFSVYKQLVSRKQVPSDSKKYGGQHGLILKK